MIASNYLLTMRLFAVMRLYSIIAAAFGCQDIATSCSSCNTVSNSFYLAGLQLSKRSRGCSPSSFSA
jgi:hypothetical protein